MKSLMRAAFVGVLAISTLSFANNGGHKKAKAKQNCPAGCTQNICSKSGCQQPATCAMPCAKH